jgi:hypothetical protein
MHAPLILFFFLMNAMLKSAWIIFSLSSISKELCIKKCYFILFIYLFIFLSFCHSKRNNFRRQKLRRNNRSNICMAVNEGDSVRVDIDRLTSSIEDMVSHDLIMPAKCCIFKTPAILYRHNEKAFIPDAFSIGPLHHGFSNLKSTEKIKAKYLKSLISRLSYSPHTDLRTLISSITDMEKDARECYGEAIFDYETLNAEEFVKILVIDGCFLIELFRKDSYQTLREEDDPIFTQSCMMQFLNHDLILLENQVPWMVLEKLFELTLDSSLDKMSLSLLAVKFFNDTFLSYRMLSQQIQTNVDQGEEALLAGAIALIDQGNHIQHIVDLDRKLSTLSTELPPSGSSPVEAGKNNIQCYEHIVDLKRNLLTSSNIEDKEERVLSDQWELLPSATSLVEAGIKFKRGTRLSSENILDIKFNDGVLEIPPLVIHDVTETAFRNLISYEQCYPKCKTRITSYAVLLDSLINTAKDMDILCENKIIENWLNPEDAAQLFNKLYLDTAVDYCYTDLCRQVNIFCRNCLPRCRAELVGKYFNTPWAGLSTSAAVILLILTFVQTWYSIKS